MPRLFLLFALIAGMLCSCGNDYGKSVSDKGHKLYYLEPVTETEAKALLNWMHEKNINFGEPAVPFQLSKAGNKYIFRHPAQNREPSEIENNLGYVQTMGEHMSRDLFRSAPLDMVIMDDQLKQTIKVISIRL